MEESALIIIDVQEAFYHQKWGVRNNPQAEGNIARILKRWREKNQMIIYIKHQSDSPTSLFSPNHDGFRIKKIVEPKKGDVVITKKVNSSFIGTELESFLHQNKIHSLVVTGLTTPHCVSTTVRMSSNLGFKTYLIEDATAAFGMTDHQNVYYDAETIHGLSIATLHQEFATILSTQSLLEV
ncbi:cysteine hydrolase family protein [Alkalihalobacillus trypoxylicola]|uniref:Isochorismatase n=1 Tax=Alkalihalobacillus trypoxylicola TaxID=519424 RepID=A0A162DFI7_9BACI|nr:cysteine hydrolase family protein [Alkalihalobacillus trypoxylicola]KYG29466.1 isochorismatase [Alkalihalobacillus trypoxylicola]